MAGRLLREAHVATVPGEGFGTREHIRVSYATSVTELDRGLERMRKFLAALVRQIAAQKILGRAPELWFRMHTA